MADPVERETLGPRKVPCVVAAEAVVAAAVAAVVAAAAAVAADVGTAEPGRRQN